MTQEKSFFGRFAKYTVLLSMVCMLFSCKENVGLGESVDTEPPTIEILYPPASAVIRGTFEFSGSWNDDKGIASITVTAINSNTKETFKTNAVEFTPDKKWKVNLNENDPENPAYYNGWQMPDGKYEVNVYAVDNSGRVSGVTARSFEIDNTMPVVMLSSPGSTVAPTPYGSSFNVEGTIVDEHTISKLAITIYDEDGNPVAKTDEVPYMETNVPTAGTTSVRLLKFNALAGEDT